MTDRLIIESFDGWERVRLNNPATLNALDDEMTDGLGEYFAGLATRPEVRVVVMKGEGRAFCSGLDLGSDQARRYVEEGSVEKFAFQKRLGAIIVGMRNCPQPIVASLHGVAAGGGFSIAMAADIRVAAEGTRMNAAFIRIGAGGGDAGSSYLLPRLIGAGPAAELLLTGRMLNAGRALRIGLLSDVVPLEDLDSTVQGYVYDMLGTAPMALRLTKDLLNYTIDAPGLGAALAMEDRNQVILGQTHNFAHGVESFGRKETPRYDPDGDAVRGSPAQGRWRSD